MNQKLHIAILLLGMMTLMPSICFAQLRSDTTLLNRLWVYQQNVQDIKGQERDVYLSYKLTTKQRNALLFLVPTMYSIAKDAREYAGEALGHLTFRTLNDYDTRWRLRSSTVPHNRKVMPAIYDILVPDIYGEWLYTDMLLSPFNRTNRHFYTYRTRNENTRQAYLSFTPRVSNTRLVSGSAIIDIPTGRVLYTEYEGEFDMQKFRVTATMDQEDTCALPEHSHAKFIFKFMGNHIVADCDSYFKGIKTLPDSINYSEERRYIEQIRPQPLSLQQQAIYQRHDSILADRQANDTTERKKGSRLADKAWDVIGYHMINSTRAKSGDASMRISPLFNPLYMSYSNSKGVSYKLKVEGKYQWDERHSLSLYSNFGYSFKKHQFYYELPLRLTYNTKRNAYVELTWGNGDRISNDALAEDFKQRTGKSSKMPEFNDEYVKAVHNIAVFNWLEMMGGVAYHIRRSTNGTLMRQAGLNDRFRSLAPLVSLRLTPWTAGPTLTANYERSFSGIMKSNLNYERWEFDMAYKYNIKGIRIFNLRGGAGFYTNRNTDYFVVYSNFRDENLPSGWDDDWTGQFQLAPAKWYNISKYYLRGHASYDSPLLLLSWLPKVGHFVETERIYLSAMSIAHTRFYYEVGYGFRCRFFSTGLFCSFLNTNIQRVGAKFTIELFHRW